jgi:ATP-dependent Clp protease, protease subunit
MFFLKHIVCVVLSLNHINTCVGFNMAFNRRTILRSGLLASSSVNLSNDIKLEEEESEGKIGRTKNSIYLTGALTEQTCWGLTESLLGYKSQLLHNDNRFNNINLYIQSPGGALLPTLAVVDEIRTLEIPVHTYIRGYAASAATLLSVMGTKRYMYNHSLMMIHGVKLNGYETNSLMDVKDLNDNVNLFMETIKNIYLENSNITEEQLEKFFLRDKWISANEALSYGLIDEII